MEKTILFVAPNYFDYHTLIKKELEKTGYKVDWFDDRPNPNLIEKCILRIHPSFLKYKTEKYFNDLILNAAKEKHYDIVFVVLGQCLTPLMCRKLRETLPDAHFIMYLWDSIKNFPQCLETSKEFDKVYSFDLRDCDKYGFCFKPLFYVYDSLMPNENRSFFDTACICTIKKGKYQFINKIKQELDEINKNNYFYLYLQSRIVRLYYKLKFKEFKRSHMKEFYYKKMSYDEMLKIVSNAKIVLDVQMENQNGLTIRTFESLALGKKLITTNTNIKNYDFYNKKRIYVYNGEKIDRNNEFFTYDFDVTKDLPFFSKYSIANWVKDILS